jgi:hypothetical protein
MGHHLEQFVWRYLERSSGHLAPPSCRQPLAQAIGSFARVGRIVEHITNRHVVVLQQQQFDPRVSRLDNAPNARAR